MILAITGPYHNNSFSNQITFKNFKAVLILCVTNVAYLLQSYYGTVHKKYGPYETYCVPCHGLS